MDGGVEPDGKAAGCRRGGGGERGGVQSKDKTDGVVVLGMVLGGVGCRW